MIDSWDGLLIGREITTAQPLAPQSHLNRKMAAHLSGIFLASSLYSGRKHLYLQPVVSEQSRFHPKSAQTFKGTVKQKIAFQDGWLNFSKQQKLRRNTDPHKKETQPSLWELIGWTLNL